MTGHIKQRSKGSWSVILFLGFDSNGKRKYKWHTVQGTKKDAQRELNRLLHELDTGQYIAPNKLTVEDYLERWLADYAKISVTAKTFERYQQIIRKSIVRQLGHHHLDKLRPLHIQAYYSWALQEGRHDKKGGLSARTVLQHHRILKEALSHAVKWQLIARNPADSVEPPKFDRKELTVLNESELNSLLRAARGTRFYMPVLLAITTGMRRGEILALRWQDIDLKAGKLSVVRSLEQTVNGITFKEPKTQKSRRVVVLPQMAIAALQEHRASQQEYRQALGTDYEDNDLVCSQPNGRPMIPNNFSSDFADLLAKAKVRRVRFHDLRHSHATILLGEGVHPKVVSERLGHSTVGITLDVYSHVLPSMQEEAARKLDRALSNASDEDDTE